jgi:osmotically-inducible protein OsmY
MSRPVYDLEHQIQTTFLADRERQDHAIEVLDGNGVITLRENVPTHAARDRVETIVREMEGVTSVINELDVL